MGTKSKVAIIDIENYPNIGAVWERYEQNVLWFEQMWSIMAFAVKWDGDKGPPVCFALPDFKKTYKNDPLDDSELTRILGEILDEADVVIGHNVDRFDLRKINARIIKNGGFPPSPYKSWDSLKIARKHFYFPSNKLGDLAEFLGCPYGSKVEHEGIKLWKKCREGDEAAWDRMRKYNIQDVRITQWLYHKLAPWGKHPNITLMGNRSNLCPHCAGPTIQRGWNELQSYRTKRYQCKKPGCRKWSSGKREKLSIEVLT